MTTGLDLELYKLKAELCKTFADARRLMIINCLRDGELSVTDLVVRLEFPQGVVSRHLGVLRQRGIVDTRRNGVNVYYRLADSKIIEACDTVHDLLMQQVARNRDLAEKYLTDTMNSKKGA